MQKSKIIGLTLVVGIIILAAVGWYIIDKNNKQAELERLYTQQKNLNYQPETDPSTAQQTSTLANPRQNTITELTDTLPTLIAPPNSLDNSDSTVLQAAADLSSKLGQWLLPNEQIRKWVLAIDLIADGKIPRRYRPIDYPMKKFSVVAEKNTIAASEENFIRAQTLINVVRHIDPEQLARYYKTWLPLLEKAYREQGKADTFDQRLRQSISRVLAVNPIAENAALIQPKVLYQYADERLEQASDIEKLLWRMGENNSDELQFFLRDFRYQLDQ